MREEGLIRHFAELAECYPWVWPPADVEPTPGLLHTSRASNGGTEAINGVIELRRRIARGFRNFDNYRLRMILAARRPTHPNLRR
jgi:hypothetical protein